MRAWALALVLALLAGDALGQSQPATLGVDQTTASRLGAPSAYSPLTDLTNTITVSENFLSNTGPVALGAGATVAGRWFGVGNSGSSGAANGATMMVDGDATNLPSLRLSVNPTGGGGTYVPALLTTGSTVTFAVQWAQKGAVAGTRRCGIATTGMQTNPVSGIWIEHTAGGAYTYQISAASFTPIGWPVTSTTTAAADTYHTFIVRYTKGSGVHNSITIYLDGVLDASATDLNFSMSLGTFFSCGSNSVTANAGLWIGYMYLSYPRIP